MIESMLTPLLEILKTPEDYELEVMVALPTMTYRYNGEYITHGSTWICLDVNGRDTVIHEKNIVMIQGYPARKK